MKIDRLLAITLYLLNRGTVSASTLAERFEVSKRTIQRDIETLNMAGIPIASTHGAVGGYEVMDGFRLQKQIAGREDFANIIVALKGLASAYGDNRVGPTLDKIQSATPHLEQKVFVDLSAARDGANTEEFLRRLEKAIHNKTLVEIEYANPDSFRTTRVVEPLALSYQWYAWYLFAYCREKMDYRMFKLPRISACKPIAGPFAKDHGDAGELLRKHNAADTREYYKIRLLCKGVVRSQVMEYLNGSIAEEREDGDFVLSMSGPYERMWFSLLLGFGDKVQVLEPEELKQMLRKKAEEILSVY